MIIKIYVKYMEEKEVLEPGNNLEKLSKFVERKGWGFNPTPFSLLWNTGRNERNLPEIDCLPYLLFVPFVYNHKVHTRGKIPGFPGKGMGSCLKNP